VPPVVAPPLFALENTFVRDLEGLFVPWQGAVAPEPRLVVLNEALAAELGVDPEALRGPDGVAVLAGSVAPEGATTVAQGYAGHQFGGYSPRLGDGRALLLGEVHDTAGRRRDIHLKGSGRTPFARGGDGKAALGPMLREYVVAEAMHALGIPTTRALAVVATGERIARDTGMLPGAVLTRVAASHLRVGSFQYAAALPDDTVLRRLADFAIDRHHPEARDADHPYLALLERVAAVQADLVARWMLVGFIHGVMNTDNMTISGETIDYGPCAFMEAYDPATVFSSIDHGGRYAFGNQPGVAQWDLARLAEALLPLLAEEAGDDVDAAVAQATEILERFPALYEQVWADGMRAKLGLGAAPDEALVSDLSALLQEQAIDWTSWFRALAADLRGDRDAARGLAVDLVAADAWLARWREALGDADLASTADAMDAVNPVYVPRNQVVEEVLDAATAGDEAPLHELLAVLAQPFTERPGLERYAAPAAPGGRPHRTFCGT
jgi:uncharacterized protein YdiU (UPF0061 family)